MTFNSQEIIQDVRAEFEQLLDFVSGEEARTAKADQIERGLYSARAQIAFLSVGLVIWRNDNPT